jgi:hypothetical protein
MLWRHHRGSCTLHDVQARVEAVQPAHDLLHMPLHLCSELRHLRLDGDQGLEHRLIGHGAGVLMSVAFSVVTSP